jgi:hypothetical protein
MKKMKSFNVLEFSNGTKSTYDILPYFRRVWKSKSFDKDKVKTKSDLQDWIIKAAQYQFWARCEYEFLMASWPFGCKLTTDKLQVCINENLDLNNISNNIKIYNIIMSEMYKIDVFEQIQMNIDIITDILSEEFKIK